ncbi:hypothetical protein T10_6364, partial [Trichinella papuae]
MPSVRHVVTYNSALNTNHEISLHQIIKPKKKMFQKCSFPPIFNTMEYLERQSTSCFNLCNSVLIAFQRTSTFIIHYRIAQYSSFIHN